LKDLKLDYKWQLVSIPSILGRLKNKTGLRAKIFSALCRLFIVSRYRKDTVAITVECRVHVFRVLNIFWIVSLTYRETMSKKCVALPMSPDNL